MTHITEVASRTPAERRRTIAALTSDQTPMHVAMRDGSELAPVVFLGVAQDGSSAAKQAPSEWSERGTLAVARFYASGNLIVLPLHQIAKLRKMELQVTDPNHPEYVEEAKVVRPIPKEAMLGRKGYQEPRPMPN